MSSPFTLVNVFTVEPSKQGELAKALAETAEGVAAKLPGFLGATVLRGLDGTRVVNYAQWTDQAAFEAFAGSDDARRRMAVAMGLGQPDAHFYEVFKVVRG